MRLAYILPRFPRLTTTFILREMLELRKLSLDVYVFSLFPPLPTLVHEQELEMMPYVYYSPFLLSSKLLQAQLYFLVRSPLRYFRALYTAIWQTHKERYVLWRVLGLFPKTVYFAKLMQDLQIDHIHAHFVWVNGIAAKVVQDLTGLTFSLHPHAFGLFMRDQTSVRRQLEFADGIVTVSDYHRQYIADLCPRWSPEEIKIVHYGLDPEEFKPEPVPHSGQTVHILSVGSLIPKKGHEYLIDACAQLSEKGRTFRCSIVGEGWLQAVLQARIDQHHLQDRVSLLGAKSQTEVKRLYGDSDIFVLSCVVAKSGDRDGMPNVLLEAMAMEIPVITTPVAGIPELVHNGLTGLLVAERDAEDLAQAIERLIDDKALRGSLGRQGRQAVVVGFEIRQSALQLEAALQDIQQKSIRRQPKPGLGASNLKT